MIFAKCDTDKSVNSLYFIFLHWTPLLQIARIPYKKDMEYYNKKSLGFSVYKTLDRPLLEILLAYFEIGFLVRLLPASDSD